MTARFWQWINGGWVKLSIAPGCGLHHATGGRTDEGWSSECSAWWVDAEQPDTVWSSHDSDGVDCDGRLSRSATFCCRVDQLDANDLDHLDPAERDGVPGVPAWERAHASQRDYAAEAMGY